MDSPGRARVKEIINTIRKKNMTADGKKRKQEIVEKVMFQDEKTLLNLHFYVAVLPIMKNYVEQFQTKEPVIHLLYVNQERAFRDFLSCYVKPEVFIASTGFELSEVNLDCDEGQFLDKSDMFIGPAATNIIIDKRRDDPVVEEFRAKAFAAYVSAGAYLQKKLPLTNRVLRNVSSIDPKARGTSITLKRMRRLPEVVTGILSSDETDQFTAEVHRFHSSTDLPPPNETRLDSWWGQVAELGTFPSICKVALAVCTIFHGPLVEASFNTMGDILDAKSSSLRIETYSAYQTVKYFLKTRGKTSLDLFKRQDYLYTKVNVDLCVNIRAASSTYRNILKEKSAQKCNAREVVSKAQDCRLVRAVAEESRARHEKQQKKEAKKKMLQELVNRHKHPKLK